MHARLVSALVALGSAAVAAGRSDRIARVMGLGAATIALAQPVTAQEVIPVDFDRVDAFFDLVTKNECRMPAAIRELLLPAAGFDDAEEVRGIVARLLYDGRARIDGDTLVAYGGACPVNEAPELKTQFLRVVSANGCQMSALDSVALLNSVGISGFEARAVLPIMMQVGTVSMSDDGRTVIMTDEDCNDYSESPEQVADVVDPVAYLADVARDHECRLHIDEATAHMAELGYDHSETIDIGARLLDAGDAQIDGDHLVLSEAMCNAAPETQEAPYAGLEPEAALIAYLEDNGCSLDVLDAQTLLPKAGLEFAKVAQVVPTLLARGDLRGGEDGRIHLDTGECADG